MITSKLPQEIVFYSKQTKTKTVVTSELPQEIVFYSKQTKIKTVVTSKLPSKHFMSSHVKINKNKVHRPIETCMTENPLPPPKQTCLFEAGTCTHIPWHIMHSILKYKQNVSVFSQKFTFIAKFSKAHSRSTHNSKTFCNTGFKYSKFLCVKFNKLYMFKSVDRVHYSISPGTITLYNTLSPCPKSTLMISSSAKLMLHHSAGHSTTQRYIPIPLFARDGYHQPWPL